MINETEHDQLMKLICEGWTLDPEQLINEGQYNSPHDSITYYDSIAGIITTI